MTIPAKNQTTAGEPRERPVGDEAILKVTKEIVIKFIEVGRLSPANFTETFNEIHRTVRDAVRP
ncbi:MAG TPA: hypothetical protein ENN98_00315 [Desulfurivibrio alkaliphilus]|uniref:Conjugal transfer protein TraB n=1 Tax=Desulfurivibrio alkaliphilus TaxID=427923 RepID=A0A7C2XN35_9BACT|nr:hypothetical protein [Desulfurivibrio alkaliphilus]